MGACCGISYSYSQYHRGSLQLAAAERGGQNTPQVQRGGGVWSARRAASPETPVQPVHPAAAGDVGAASPAGLGLPIRQGADPVEMAVRMRIRPYEENKGAPAMAGLENGEGPEEAVGAESAQKALEEGECQTCEKRKYQDGSDEMVSFKSPQHVSPENAASAVRAHEQEHVSNAYKKAAEKNGKVVSASVSIHTGICPECGRSYVTGGTTRTQIKYYNEDNPYQKDLKNTDRMKYAGMNLDCAV